VKRVCHAVPEKTIRSPKSVGEGGHQKGDVVEDKPLKSFGSSERSIGGETLGDRTKIQKKKRAILQGSLGKSHRFAKHWHIRRRGNRGVK